MNEKTKIIDNIYDVLILIHDFPIRKSNVPKYPTFRETTAHHVGPRLSGKLTYSNWMKRYNVFR